MHIVVIHTLILEETYIATTATKQLMYFRIPHNYDLMRTEVATADTQCPCLPKKIYFHAFNTKPNKITLAYGARAGEEIFKIRLPKENN